MPDCTQDRNAGNVQASLSRLRTRLKPGVERCELKVQVLKELSFMMDRDLRHLLEDIAKDLERLNKDFRHD